MDPTFSAYVLDDSGAMSIERVALPNETYEDGKPVFEFTEQDLRELVATGVLGLSGIDRELLDKFLEDPFANDVLLNFNTILVVRW